MMATKYRAKLESVGNPDFRQYAPISDPVDAVGDTVAEVVRVAMDYRDAWDLGGGNWPEILIRREDGSVVGQVSYNGRLWEPMGEGPMIDADGDFIPGSLHQDEIDIATAS